MKSIFTCLLLLGSLQLAAQQELPARSHWQNLQLAPYTSATGPHKAKTTTGMFDTTAWAGSIDSYWGSGISTATKLTLFDAFWQEMSDNYPCFVQLPAYNWDSILTAKRNEISQGVSRGRFAGIIGDLMTFINDGHSNFYDATVSYTTPVAPGLPVFRGQSGRFGACITALPDSSALVCEAVNNHPFGLQPGDIILGYNGIAWKELVKLMLRHQVPNSVFKGSTSWATWQRYIKAAGENWYLFDTINIRKCNGTLVNHPTVSMVGTAFTLFCPDQLPVPGVSRLTRQDIQAYKAYSSGVVTGTSVGYVYIYDCLDMSGDSLYQRVKTLVEDSLITGLILDIRTNFGGSINAFAKTFRYLNNGNASWLGWGERNDPNNKYSMVNNGAPSGYDIFDTDPAFFSGPVAILTGPEALSAGDLLPVLFGHSNQVRTFGRSTGGAFGAYKSIPNNVAGYVTARQQANFFEPSNSSFYLSHTEYPVDVPVWLTQSSVCAGPDTVVQTALNWIWQTTNVPGLSRSAPEVIVYPVPSSGNVQMRIRAGRAENIQLVLTDATGKVVSASQRYVLEGENLIPLDHNLPSGYYQIELKGSFGSITRKVIVL
jgi:hypothetical protein